VTHISARSAAVALGLVAALALTGCAAEAGSGSPVPTDRVDMPRSYRFAPAAITVPAGSTVTWTNNDQFTHSVRLPEAEAPDMVVKPGETVSHVFETPGTYPYLCTFHPNDMTGTVLVSAG
jgi:plastocyanin